MLLPCISPSSPSSWTGRFRFEDLSATTFRAGSGFCIDAERRVLITNAHCVEWHAQANHLEKFQQDIRYHGQLRTKHICTNYQLSLSVEDLRMHIIHHNTCVKKIYWYCMCVLYNCVCVYIYIHTQKKAQITQDTPAHVWESNSQQLCSVFGIHNVP